MCTETYDVVGMTCDHCVHAVTTEVSALTGVSQVQVDLPTGKVHVTSQQPVPTARLREAIEEAGYSRADRG